MIIVSDSSPLIALSLCGKLGILEKLYSDVLIPYAVFDEISIPHKPFADELLLWAQEKIAIINDIDLANAINIILDRGESEAIVLYNEIKADALLIDEKAGREYAENYGVNIIGTLGILLKAKQQGLIKEIKPDIDLLKQSPIRISDTLYEKILALAGE
jgi:predicted nucleic acid-binding protein